MIKWEPSMSTGVETVDDQHRQLIAWLNDLLGAMKEGRGRGEIQHLLDELGGYAATHFAHEEGCMARYHCPVAAANMAAHQDFVRVFGAFKAEFERVGATSEIVVRVQRELMAWLTGHIKGIDTQLYPCVKAAGPSA